jgi:hypothetical protein
MRERPAKTSSHAVKAAGELEVVPLVMFPRLQGRCQCETRVNAHSSGEQARALLRYRSAVLRNLRDELRNAGARSSDGLFSQVGGHVYRSGDMAARLLFAALTLVACAPASRSVATAPAVAPATPTAAERVPPRRHRHLARLTPPFAVASGSRRVTGDTVVTALVSAP